MCLTFKNNKNNFNWTVFDFKTVYMIEQIEGEETDR
jgi:hypothetical protein